MLQSVYRFMGTGAESELVRLIQDRSGLFTQSLLIFY